MKDPRGRLTVIEQVVHYSDVSGQPTEHTHVHTSQLQSAEQPYIRVFPLPGDDGWKPLTFGWLEAVSLVLLSCKDAPVDVGVGSGGDGAEDVATFAEVPPGQELRLPPVEGCKYFVKNVSNFGPAVVTVRAFPK